MLCERRRPTPVADRAHTHPPVCIIDNMQACVRSTTVEQKKKKKSCYRVYDEPRRSSGRRVLPARTAGDKLYDIIMTAIYILFFFPFRAFVTTNYGMTRFLAIRGTAYYRLPPKILELPPILIASKTFSCHSLIRVVSGDQMVQNCIHELSYKLR